MNKKPCKDIFKEIAETTIQITENNRHRKYLTFKPMKIQRHLVHIPRCHLKHTDVVIFQQFKGEETGLESSSTLTKEIVIGAI